MLTISPLERFSVTPFSFLKTTLPLIQISKAGTVVICSFNVPFALICKAVTFPSVVENISLR
jgi:hypothetical protein